MEITRRDFLYSGVMAQRDPRNLQFGCEPSRGPKRACRWPRELAEYGNGGSLSERWTGIGSSREPHAVNCIAACSWNLYVKTHRLAEEQNTSTSESSDRARHEPASCQKGACYSGLITSVAISTVGRSGSAARQWTPFVGGGADAGCDTLLDVALRDGRIASFTTTDTNIDFGTGSERDAILRPPGATTMDSWRCWRLPMGDSDLGKLQCRRTSDDWFTPTI